MDGSERPSLPALRPWHGDPFDRALIAQCNIGSLTFATRDAVMGSYNIGVLEA